MRGAETCGGVECDNRFIAPNRLAGIATIRRAITSPHIAARQPGEIFRPTASCTHPTTIAATAAAMEVPKLQSNNRIIRSCMIGTFLACLIHKNHR